MTFDTVHVAANGAVTYGVPVPHEAANIRCFALIGTQRDPVNGVEYDLHCKKRAGHPTPKGEEPHVPVDFRLIASSPHKTHVERFKPNTLPSGVDQSITLPHDCANHLPDTEEVLRRGW